MIWIRCRLCGNEYPNAASIYRHIELQHKTIAVDQGQALEMIRSQSNPNIIIEEEP